MRRRSFLQALMTSTMTYMGTGYGIGSLIWPGDNMAKASTSGKTLVVIFQRGGCDGLNTCIPYGDANYYDLRPTIGVAPPDVNNPVAAIDLDGFFGLHPSLAPLKPLYDLGDLAVFPATHYPSGSHSHFDAQQFIESAAASRRLEGWLNRHLQMLDHTHRFQALAFGQRLPYSLRGTALVSAINNLSQYSPGVNSRDVDRFLQDIETIYQQPTSTQPYQSLLNDTGLALLDNFRIVQNIDFEAYQPEYGASYPDSTLGRQLKQLAQLIKSNIGLEIGTLDIGGWDTHSGQGGGETNGRQARLHQQLATGIAAFYTDLGEQMQNVVVMTCTEFGRTAKENASKGTDHGNASTWFVVGGAIQGGVYGQWPGLASDQLLAGRYLDFSIDYRDIMAEILQHHLQNRDVRALLQGYQSTSLGLFT